MQIIKYYISVSKIFLKGKNPNYTDKGWVWQTYISFSGILSFFILGCFLYIDGIFQLNHFKDNSDRQIALFMSFVSLFTGLFINYILMIHNNSFLKTLERTSDHEIMKIQGSWKEKSKVIIFFAFVLIYMCGGILVAKS